MELNTILDILTTNNLSADELLFIYLILLAQSEEEQAEYFIKWYNTKNKETLKQLVESLKNKKIIESASEVEFDPDNIIIKESFLKKWYKQSGILGQELFDNYESFMEINGKIYSLKNISKKFYSLEEFYRFYARTIKNSIEKHKEIMELLKWAKENKVLRYGIIEFVSSQKWIEIKQMKDDNKTDILSNTFAMYESI